MGKPIKGYTNNPYEAYKTEGGYVVAAPAVAKAISSVHYEKIAQLWEYLLDSMEEYYRIEEQGDSADRDIRKEAILKCDVLKDALAILQYGWTFQHNPVEARGLISREANVRYNMSAGE